MIESVSEKKCKLGLRGGLSETFLDALWRNSGTGTRPASTYSLRVCFRSSNERYENGK